MLQLLISEEFWGADQAKVDETEFILTRRCLQEFTSRHLTVANPCKLLRKLVVQLHCNICNALQCVAVPCLYKYVLRVCITMKKTLAQGLHDSRQLLQPRTDGLLHWQRSCLSSRAQIWEPNISPTKWKAFRCASLLRESVQLTCFLEMNWSVSRKWRWCRQGTWAIGWPLGINSWPPCSKQWTERNADKCKSFRPKAHWIHWYTRHISGLVDASCF